ncbi:hypothetical protein VDG1235_3862 [Verrucomicrobiia bacterium DG1235]|nr:hypothetical protein VDG1235_3862 [Verrucomicrobiae bacterium DG1235]
MFDRRSKRLTSLAGPPTASAAVFSESLFIATQNSASLWQKSCAKSHDPAHKTVFQ